MTYAWPRLTAPQVRPFLRGYVDGDGCVGIYSTPQGNPMLHLSFVGTPGFTREAMRAIPAAGRYRLIKRCASLAEVRYSGRHAWTAANWLYTDPELYRGPKWETFQRYRQLLTIEPPRWHRQGEARASALVELGAGRTVNEAATVAGVSVATVYAWRREALLDQTDVGVPQDDPGRDDGTS